MNAVARRAQPLLGTIVAISASASTEAAAARAIEAAFAAVRDVHHRMSYQSPDSELTRLNRLASRQAVVVSPGLWQVLCAARRFAQASDGLFDITVAPALTRLGYLPRHAGMPRADGRADWRHVLLLDDGRRVRFERALRIDLSGIAKGHAVDRAIDALRAAGAHGACVNAGGDLRLFGTEEQTIEVRHPGAPDRTLPLLRLREGAVATSANYYTRRRRAGRIVSPLLGPDRRCAGTQPDSVTVQAGDCTTADALTKVAHADWARAQPVLRRFGARAVLLRGDEISGQCAVFDSHPREEGCSPQAACAPAPASPVPATVTQ